MVRAPPPSGSLRMAVSPGVGGAWELCGLLSPWESALASGEVSRASPSVVTHGTPLPAPNCPGIWGGGLGAGEGSGRDRKGCKWLAHSSSFSSVLPSLGIACQSRVPSAFSPRTGWGLGELKSARWPQCLIPSLFPKGQKNPEPREAVR